MELKLVVLAGAKQGLEIPLKKDKFLIGRAKECALRAGSEAISRRHCVLARQDDLWTVRDLGSRNGTYVNDKRITDEVTLNPGDELRVGPLKFRVASLGAVVAEKQPSTVPQEKPHKQPPVKSVADVVERTIEKSGGGATEDDISRWLLGLPENDTDAAVKETRTLRLEETKTFNRATVEELPISAAASATSDSAEQAASAVNPEEAEEKSGGWGGLFKRGKAAPKKKPGKLPPRPEHQTKDSREAAADILREMTRRR